MTLLAAGMILAPYEPRVPRTYGATVSTPTVGVWSNDCGSFNISIASCSSGFLNVGNTITVQVNVTNAAVGTVNGYEFFLYYDPAFLSASFDSTTGTTGTVFKGQFVTVQDVATPGTVHMGAVCFDPSSTSTCYNTNTNGALVNINFKILAVGVSPLTLATGLFSSGFAQSFTVLTKPTGNGANNRLAPVTADGYFKNENVNLGPVASFSFLPASPKSGQQVTFYANASFDPDVAAGSPNNGILFYNWDFGGASPGSTKNGESVYSFRLGSITGNFSVRLTVVDTDNNFEGMKTELFTVAQNPFHDLVAQSISAYPYPAIVGDQVRVVGYVFNSYQGSSPENFNLVVSYRYPITIIGTLTNQSIAVGAISLFNFTLDTSHLAPGFYTIAANVTVLPSPGNPSGVDSIPANNVVTNILDIIPPPTPDFSIMANPRSLAIQTGRNGTSTITLTSIAGFSGNIALSASVFPVVNATGPMATLQPTSLRLGAGGTASSTLTVSTLKNTPQFFYNVVVIGTNGTMSHSSFIGVEIVPPPDLPPVANFAFSPPSPVTGQVVSFDGSSSFDPDGSVLEWSWNFGDGSFFGFGPFTSHTYSSIGSYTVTLTVRDNAGLSASKSVTLQVRPRPLHDVSIAAVQSYPNIAVSSQFVSINVEISNDGLSNETVSLTAFYDSHPIQTLTNIFVPLQNCSQFFCQSGTYVTITWDTTGVAAGNYTISATVFLAPGETDPTPSDNSVTGNKITILPPPVLTVTPSNGGVGAKVLVQGSGFLTPQFFFQSFASVDVTFDDQFIGFTFTNNGRFNFTFDIPDAQPGPHLVKAIGFDGIHASTAFQVIPTASSLSVSVNTGAIYFPGDTVTIYILATLNGTPLSTGGIQLQLGLFLPNGTKVTLSTTPITQGLFKAIYKISKTGPLGTYAVVATGNAIGASDASSLGNFEVKLSWLSSQGQNIIGATTIAGAVGLAAVAWRKGYLRRKDET